MAIPGAPAALKGYRLQHLYILHRLLLDPGAVDLAFQLEGSEDLDLIARRTGALIESVQIKAYDGKPITASDLFSKDDSFFSRAEKRLLDYPFSVQKIIGFGPFGLNIQGAVAGSPPELEATLKYLKGKGFSADRGRCILASTQLETVSEETLERDTLGALGETLAGADPQTTFLFLSGWMIRASEQRERITRDTLHARLQAIGSLINESAVEHLNWGSVIRPIEEEGTSAQNLDELEEEFFQGTYTAQRHIQARLDVPRPSVLEEIDTLLSRFNAVAVHGASGQGKTALAYRYLLDRPCGAWRFEVKHIEDGVHALQLSRVLAKHARAIGVRLLVYIDVPPLNTAWRIVVRDLSAIGNVKILVTLREDDWNRAKSDGMQFVVGDLQLAFSETEAQDLYRAITRKQKVSRWIDFADAWSHFGGQGPLMEFTYLLTQCESLQNRLATQVRALRNQVRLGNLSGAELELLRRVAVASSFSARLDLRRAGTALCLPDPGMTVAMFEREYLLRVDEHGRCLSGLHPLRSGILAAILTDEGSGASWAETARACLPSMEEADIEPFLIAVLLAQPMHAASLFQQLSDFSPPSWRVCAGILRALIVKGVEEYVSNHARPLAQAQAMFSGGWWLIVPFDLTGIRSEIKWPSSTAFERADVKELVARFGDAQSVLSFAKKWLSLKLFESLPMLASEVESVSEIVFWARQLRVPEPARCLHRLTLETAPLSLEVLLDFICSCSPDKAVHEFGEFRDAIMDRFRHEHRVLCVESVDDSLRCHYIYDLAALQSGLDRANDVVMARVNALRCLAPTNDRFGATGYGHAIEGPLAYDPAYKSGVPRTSLPSRRLVQVNSAFMALAERVMPKESWETYAERVMKLRRDILAGLNMLCRFVNAYFRTKQAQRPQEIGFDVDLWCAVAEDLRVDVQMPRLGTPLGTPLTLDELTDRKSGVSVLNSHDAAIKKYFGSLQHFFTQIPTAILVSIYVGRTLPHPSNVEVARWLQENNVSDTRHIAASNILDAQGALVEAQRGFDAVMSRMPTSGLPLSEEEETVTKTVNLWFLMAYSSVMKTTEAHSVAVRKYGLPLDRLRGDLARRFTDAIADGQKISLLDKTVVDDERGWVVAVDVSSVWEMDAAFLRVLDIVRAVIASHFSSVLLLLLCSQARYIFVVPTVQGRTVAPMGWKLLSTTLPPAQTADSVPSPQMQCRPFGDLLWSQVGLPEWGGDFGEPMLQLLKDARGFHERIRHACEIARSPADDLGRCIRNEYWREIWPDFVQSQGRVADSLHPVMEELQGIAVFEQAMASLAETLSAPVGVCAECFPESEILEAWERKQRSFLDLCARLWMFWCDVEVENRCA